MSIAEAISLISVVIAFLSFAIQQHLTRKQSRADARIRLHEGTRTLLLTALDDPELLDAISGDSEEIQKQRRYRQLWMNHIEMIFHSRVLFDETHWKGTLSDLRDFMEIPQMRKHWQNYRHFYSESFQHFVEHEVLEGKGS